MGRSPCCDKVGLKKGPWTPEEDQKLLAFIQEHGHGSWRALPSKAGLQRCGKSCRLRWINYLRPDIKRGKFSVQEEQTIIQLHALLGNRWSAIATHLSKRTDNEIKNYWNTHLKKRLVKMGIDPVSHKLKNDALLFNDGHLKSTANLSHMAQWESARLEAESRLVKQSKLLSMKSLSHMNSILHSLTSTSRPPPRCFDIHKACNGILGNTLNVGANVNKNGDTKSPTSTLSTTKLGDSSTNLFELIVGVKNSLGSGNNETTLDEHVEEWEYEDHGNGTGNIVPMASDLIMPTVDSAWTTQLLKSGINNDEFVPGVSFFESFTDLLLCSSNCSDQNKSLNGDYSSDIGLIFNNSNSDPSESIKDGYEDKNKNYWDNVLNLVNSSPSNSLMY